MLMDTYCREVLKTNKIFLSIQNDIKRSNFKEKKITTIKHHKLYTELLDLLLQFTYSSKFLNYIFKLMNVPKDKRKYILHNILYQYSRSDELIDDLMILILLS